MSTEQSKLYYGLFLGVAKLCVAAEAYSRVKPQLDFFQLLQLRIFKGTLSFSATVGVMNVSRIPQDVWEMVKDELNRIVLEEADPSFSKVPIKLDYEAIRNLLSTFGLVLPSTRLFTLNTNSFTLLHPVAFPFSQDPPGTSLLPINIAPMAYPFPFSPGSGSFIPSTDFSIPFQRVTSPSGLTQSTIANASLEIVPGDIAHRFERLARLYHLSIVNALKSDRWKEQILLFKFEVQAIVSERWGRKEGIA
ncbi:hypothetical protein JCM5353_001003 [Sporobolomyces roseus]